MNFIISSSLGFNSKLGYLMVNPGTIPVMSRRVFHNIWYNFINIFWWCYTSVL